jgi:hypothetical protein
MQVELYGTEDPKTLDWLNRLRLNLPKNVTFKNPIFGLDKAKMLSGATFYLQPSRWEGFPVSVAECLHLGVPSVIADTLDLAQLFFQHDLGLVIPLNPPQAAAQIRAAIANPNKLIQWSERGRQFALEHFHPSAVAQKHKMFLCVQDLTCPGASLIHSAGLAAHVPGVAAIEANARQYVPAANKPWEASHPGIFIIKDGTMQTGILNRPGLSAV